MKNDIIFQKMEGLIKIVDNKLNEKRSRFFDPDLVLEHFELFKELRSTLEKNDETLLKEMPKFDIPKPKITSDNEGRGYIERKFLQKLCDDLGYILILNPNNKGESDMGNTNNLEDMKKEIDELKNFKLKVEKYISVIIILAVVFGFGGAWGYSFLTKSSDELENLSNEIENLSKKTQTINSKFEKIREAEIKTFKDDLKKKEFFFIKNEIEKIITTKDLNVIKNSISNLDKILNLLKNRKIKYTLDPRGNPPSTAIEGEWTEHKGDGKTPDRIKIWFETKKKGK